jgi:hypothetical protein
MPRSESDILAMAPVKVKLGAKEYDIPAPPIPHSQAWRKKLIDVMGEIALFEALTSAASGEDSKTVSKMMTSVLLEFPDKLMQMVFEAGPDLPKEEIMQSATEEQMAIAYSQLMAVMFPCLPEARATLKMMRSRATQ